MRKLLLGLLLASAICRGQVVSSSQGSIPSTGGGASCVTVNTDGQGIVGISVTDTWTGTLQGRVSIGGDAPQNVQVTPYSSSTAQSTITANGTFTANVVGSQQFQLCGNTVASGTATVKLNVVKLAANRNAGTGSGSGTVSANSGTAGAVANYAAAGGSTTVGPDATLVDNAATLTYSGSTGIVAPAGSSTAPAYAFTGALTTGPSLAAANVAGMTSNGVLVAQFTGGIEVTQSASFKASQTALANGAVGVSLAPIGTGTTEAWNIGGTSTSLFLQNGACKIPAAGIALPVNTATTVCSWTLPNSAQTWAWQCVLPWAITAGTGTNTLAISVSVAQTPTSTTNGTAEILTTNTMVGTENTAAISASGATTLLTSGTITPAATVFRSSTAGTLAANAASGIFAIQMTAAGTTATAAAQAGGTCFLY